MKVLQVKSIVIIIIAILISTNLFSQNQNATTTEYTDKAEFFEGQKTHALKVNFIGNFMKTTKVSYEQILKPGRSVEFKATVIEGGNQGLLGSVGYKLYRKPTFIAPGMQRRNILEGAYLKPEIFVGSMKNEGFLESSSEATISTGLVLNIGKQWVIADNILIDLYAGTGIGNGDHIRGYLVGSGLVLTSGLNFGFSF